MIIKIKIRNRFDFYFITTKADNLYLQHICATTCTISVTGFGAYTLRSADQQQLGTCHQMATQLAKIKQKTINEAPHAQPSSVTQLPESLQSDIDNSCNGCGCVVMWRSAWGTENQIPKCTSCLVVPIKASRYQCLLMSC